MNRAVVVGSVAAIILVGLGATGIYTARKNAAVPARTVDAPPAPAGSSDDLMLAARTRGDDKAPVVIYEVSDFQCPYCRQFWAETLPQLDKEYIKTGKARLTFINFPIPQLHPNAQAAHEVAMCGAAQGKFWRLHDLLYAHQQEWAALPDPQPYLLALGDSAHADRGTLQACLAAGRIRQLVAAEAQASWQAGVKSTPSFIVQGVLLAGTAPIEQFRPILDSIYAARTEKR